MILKVHRLDMGDLMVIKTDEIKAEMVNHIEQNMTTTLILNQVDKYFHRVSINYTIIKKTLALGYLIVKRGHSKI